MESKEASALYVCDPLKNINCTKTGCHTHEGPCHNTRHVEFAKTDTKGAPILAPKWEE